MPKYRVRNMWTTPNDNKMAAVAGSPESDPYVQLFEIHKNNFL